MKKFLEKLARSCTLVKQACRKTLKSRIVRSKWTWFILIVVVALIVLSAISREKKKAREFITLKVKKQTLVISVLEGGNLQALTFQKIVNEVPGTRNILYVVSEGTEITEADVKEGKVLVQLDSKDIDDQIQQQEITVENSWSNFLNAQENLAIQKKQNESDIRQAELTIRFAQMDLEKYLGKTLASQLIEGKTRNFASLVSSPELAGEALNKKREIDAGRDLSREEVARSQDTVDWSEKLASKGYVTKSELEADKLALQQKKVSQEKTGLNAQLFLNYDFPKQVEKLYSDYIEALANLERVQVKCQSKIVQNEASIKSYRATYMRQKNHLEELKKRLSNCMIRATQTGFVTYATSSNPWRSDNPIQPGTTVRLYQELLNLPDFNSMGVEVKIHESAVEKIKPDLKARIRVDAFPKEKFTGTVKKIALMPDPTLKWLNPDINLYVAKIALDKISPLLKPGMSAQVEIVVDELHDVIAIPLAAISLRGSKPTCTVLHGRTLETRELILGQSNDEMVEVKSGLKEGEILVMTAESRSSGKKEEDSAAGETGITPAPKEQSNTVSAPFSGGRGAESSSPVQPAASSGANGQSSERPQSILRETPAPAGQAGEQPVEQRPSRPRRTDASRNNSVQ